MKKIFSLAVLLVISSCGISYKMPDNRFETPETNGGLLKSQLQVGHGLGKDIELTRDYSHVWVNAQDPRIEEQSFINFGASMGLLESLDLGVDYISDVGGVFKAKWQFSGKTGDDGLHAAIVGKLGAGSQEKNEKNSTPTSAKLENDFKGFDLVAGWRLGKVFLAYTSIFFDSANYEVNQVRGNVAQKFIGSSKNYGATLGLHFSINDRINLLAEGSRAKVKSGHSIKTGSALGGRFSFSF